MTDTSASLADQLQRRFPRTARTMAFPSRRNRATTIAQPGPTGSSTPTPSTQNRDSPEPQQIPQLPPGPKQNETDQLLNHLIHLTQQLQQDHQLATEHLQRLRI